MSQKHPSSIKIGLMQMRAEKGAVTENLKDISGFISEAEKRGIDIVGLPEASITGYINPTRYPHAIIAIDGQEVDNLLRMSRGRKTTVLAGLIENNPAGKPFITHIAFRDGKIIGTYRKRRLGGPPDTEWFSRGRKTTAFKFKDLKYGIAICADIDGENIFAEYVRQGAQIVFELAAPGLYGEQSTRDWQKGFKWWERVCLRRLGKYAKKYGIWIAVATQAGRTSDEDFPGGGYVFNPDGQRVYATKDWNPCEVYLEIDLEGGVVSEIS
jgi:predicted amidohydrolase